METDMYIKDEIKLIEKWERVRGMIESCKGSYDVGETDSWYITIQLPDMEPVGNIRSVDQAYWFMRGFIS